MNDSSLWSVDRLAANNLLVHLGLETDSAKAEMVAQHFAKHRRDAHGWAAERTRSNILKAFAAVGVRLCADKSEVWADGFFRAEREVLTMPSEELLGVERGKPASKGQILRNLVRRARAEARSQ